MKHFGDITKINGAEVPPVDVICGGSPCQDLSVAGKREGLSGARSGLFMEQIRVIKEMRDECLRKLSMRGADVDLRYVQPRYMVWENVPGAFSSNKGEDFRAVIEETAKIADKDAVIPRPTGGRWSPSGCVMGNGWSIAWRVHDAQFWGVPQRRKRIALVADFGGSSAPEILFERKSLSGDSEQSEQTREETSGTVGECVDKAISFQERAGKSGGAKESSSSTNEQEPCQRSTISMCIGGGQVHDAVSPSVEVSKTLNCMDDPMKVVCYGLDRASFNQGKNAQYDISIQEEIAQPLVARGAGGGYSPATVNGRISASRI